MSKQNKEKFIEPWIDESGWSVETFKKWRPMLCGE